jgi:uncharacterized protein
MFEPRLYRNSFNPERFSAFTLQYRDTDVWVGVDKSSFRTAMAEKTRDVVTDLWQKLESYALLQSGFFTSHLPLNLLASAPGEALLMAEAGFRTLTGPMAAVAGLFAWKIGEALREEFKVRELVVENGGDYYLLLEEDLNMTIHAGNSPLSGKIAVVIPAGSTPCGVCTSSGTVGHSFSYGKADAVMVACPSPVLADAWATALANRVKRPDDIPAVLSYSEDYPEIESVVIICEDKVGIRGNFEARMVKK